MKDHLFVPFRSRSAYRHPADNLAARYGSRFQPDSGWPVVTAGTTGGSGGDS